MFKVFTHLNNKEPFFHRSKHPCFHGNSKTKTLLILGSLIMFLIFGLRDNKEEGVIWFDKHVFRDFIFFVGSFLIFFSHFKMAKRIAAYMHASLTLSIIKK